MLVPSQNASTNYPWKTFRRIKVVDGMGSGCKRLHQIAFANIRHRPVILVLSLLILLALVSCLTGPIEPEPIATPDDVETLGVMGSEIVDVFAINKRLGRGVNLGNALEAPAEGDWGVTLEAEYFQLIAEQGFDSVRIPIRWSAHASQNEPYHISRSFFDRVDWAVSNAISQDLAVVINFHHYDGIFSDPQGQEERFLALWRQVAEHYQDAPTELVFEILNEPHEQLEAVDWNLLLVKALSVIRETNPERAVVVGPPNWNAIHQLGYLALPEDDRNLIVTFHYYEPFEFTHQGAEWNPGSDEWLGNTWHGMEDQKQAIIRDMDLAAAWAEHNNRPLYMGEFGAYSKADMDSRAEWTAFVVKTASARNISWAYWEFCAGFGIYDPLLDMWIKPLVAALLSGE